MVLAKGGGLVEGQRAEDPGAAQNGRKNRSAPLVLLAAAAATEMIARPGIPASYNSPLYIPCSERSLAAVACPNPAKLVDRWVVGHDVGCGPASC